MALNPSPEDGNRSSIGNRTAEKDQKCSNAEDNTKCFVIFIRPSGLRMVSQQAAYCGCIQTMKKKSSH
jgi:hypothetical protein